MTKRVQPAVKRVNSFCWLLKNQRPVIHCSPHLKQDLCLVSHVWKLKKTVHVHERVLKTRQSDEAWTVRRTLETMRFVRWHFFSTHFGLLGMWCDLCSSVSPSPQCTVQIIDAPFSLTELSMKSILYYYNYILVNKRLHPQRNTFIGVDFTVRRCLRFLPNTFKLTALSDLSYVNITLEKRSCNLPLKCLPLGLVVISRSLCKCEIML